MAVIKDISVNRFVTALSISSQTTDTTTFQMADDTEACAYNVNICGTWGNLGSTIANDVTQLWLGYTRLVSNVIEGGSAIKVDEYKDSAETAPTFVVSAAGSNRIDLKIGNASEFDTFTGLLIVEFFGLQNPVIRV